MLLYCLAPFKRTFQVDILPRQEVCVGMCYLFSLLKCIFNFPSLIHERYGKLFPVILRFATLLYDTMNGCRERAWLASIIRKDIRRIILRKLIERFRMFCENAQIV